MPQRSRDHSVGARHVVRQLTSAALIASDVLHEVKGLQERRTRPLHEKSLARREGAANLLVDVVSGAATMSLLGRGAPQPHQHGAPRRALGHRSAAPRRRRTRAGSGGGSLAREKAAVGARSGNSSVLLPLAGCGLCFFCVHGGWGTSNRQSTETTALEGLQLFLAPAHCRAPPRSDAHPCYAAGAVLPPHSSSCLAATRDAAAALGVSSLSAPGRSSRMRVATAAACAGLVKRRCSVTGPTWDILILIALLFTRMGNTLAYTWGAQA